MKLTKSKLKQIIREELDTMGNVHPADQGLKSIVPGGEGALPSGRAVDTRGGPHMSAEKFVDMFMAFAYMVKSDQVRPDEFKGAIAKLAVDAGQAQANPTGEDF